MLNNRYKKNQKKRVDGYDLQISPSGIVYHDSKRGFVKLDSLWNKKIGKLSVVLPNEESIFLIPTKNGIKTDEELKEDVKE